MSEINERVKGLEEHVHKIQTYFKVAFFTAVIFGIAGSIGATILFDSAQRISNLRSEISGVEKRFSDIREDAETEFVAFTNVQRNALINDTNIVTSEQLATLENSIIGTIPIDEVQVLQSRIDTLEDELKSLELTLSNSCWSSDWVSVEMGQSYRDVSHGLSSTPTQAFLWLSPNSNGQTKMLIDSVFNGGGYGAWILGVSSSSYTLTIGPSALYSVYGGVEAGSFYSVADGTRGYLQVVFCK